MPFDLAMVLFVWIFGALALFCVFGYTWEKVFPKKEVLRGATRNPKK